MLDLNRLVTAATQEAWRADSDVAGFFTCIAEMLVSDTAVLVDAHRREDHGMWTHCASPQVA